MNQIAVDIEFLGIIARSNLLTTTAADLLLRWTLEDEEMMQVRTMCTSYEVESEDALVALVDQVGNLTVRIAERYGLGPDEMAHALELHGSLFGENKNE